MLELNGKAFISSFVVVKEGDSWKAEVVLEERRLFGESSDWESKKIESTAYGKTFGDAYQSAMSEAVQELGDMFTKNSSQSMFSSVEVPDDTGVTDSN